MIIRIYEEIDMDGHPIKEWRQDCEFLKDEKNDDRKMYDLFFTNYQEHISSISALLNDFIKYSLGITIFSLGQPLVDMWIVDDNSLITKQNKIIYCIALSVMSYSEKDILFKKWNDIVERMILLLNERGLKIKSNN